MNVDLGEMENLVKVMKKIYVVQDYKYKKYKLYYFLFNAKALALNLAPKIIFYSMPKHWH